MEGSGLNGLPSSSFAGQWEVVEGLAGQASFTHYHGPDGALPMGQDDWNGLVDY